MKSDREVNGVNRFVTYRRLAISFAVCTAAGLLHWHTPTAIAIEPTKDVASAMNYWGKALADEIKQLPATRPTMLEDFVAGTLSALDDKASLSRLADLKAASVAVKEDEDFAGTPVMRQLDVAYTLSLAGRINESRTLLDKAIKNPAAAEITKMLGAGWLDMQQARFSLSYGEMDAILKSIRALPATQRASKLRQVGEWCAVRSKSNAARDIAHEIALLPLHKSADAGERPSREMAASLLIRIGDLKEAMPLSLDNTSLLADISAKARRSGNLQLAREAADLAFKKLSEQKKPCDPIDINSVAEACVRCKAESTDRMSKLIEARRLTADDESNSVNLGCYVEALAWVGKFDAAEAIIRKAAERSNALKRAGKDVLIQREDFQGFEAVMYFHRQEKRGEAVTSLLPPYDPPLEGASPAREVVLARIERGDRIEDVCRPLLEANNYLSDVVLALAVKAGVESGRDEKSLRDWAAKFPNRQQRMAVEIGVIGGINPTTFGIR